MKKVLVCMGLALMVLFCGAIVQAQDKATINYGDSDLTISGYGHFWFSSIEDDKDTGKVTDGFDTRRVRLILTGKLASQIIYKIQFDMDSEDLKDYWVKFNEIMKNESLTLNATAGQGKIHFSEAERVWVSPADCFIRGVRIYEGGVTRISDRDMGLTFDGKAVDGKLTFYLGYLNGSGIGDTGETNTAGDTGETNIGDDKDNKEFLLRLILAPFEDEQLKDLTFALGYMSGSQFDTGGTGVRKRDRLSATVKYKKGDLQALAEYISQTLEESVASPLTWDEAETTNLYLQGAYTVRPEFLKDGQELQLVLRYQQYENDNGDKISLAAGDEETTMITAGANLVFSKNVRFMFNYNMIDDDTYVPAKNKRLDTDNNEILMQLELKF